MKIKTLHKTGKMKKMEAIRKLFLTEGIQKALYAFGAFVVFLILDLEFFVFVALLLVFFFLFAYRNPSGMEVDLSDYGVFAPVDGRITLIKDVDESGYGYIVTIESSLLDAGVLKTPFGADISSLEIQRGSHLPLESKLFDTLNERLVISFEKNNKKVKISHTLKRSPFDIEVYVGFGAESASGKPYGYAYNCVTHLYLPKEFRLNISVGAKLSCAQTIVGYFSR